VTDFLRNDLNCVRWRPLYQKVVNSATSVCVSLFVPKKRKIQQPVVMKRAVLHATLRVRKTRHPTHVDNFVKY